MELSLDDRMALSDLGASYARCADEREYTRMAACFAEDGVLDTGRGVRQGRAVIEEALHALERYDSTFHHVGQSQHWVDDAGVVRGLTYCIAHHFTAAEDGGGTHDRVMYIRYHDEFDRSDGDWVFAQRRLEVVFTGREDKP